MTKINIKPVFVHATANKEDNLGDVLGSDRSATTCKAAPLYCEVLRSIH